MSADAACVVLTERTARARSSMTIDGCSLTASLPCTLANFALFLQTQVGFSSKKDPSSTTGSPLMLPTPAFKKLSGMESLAGVLAGLAQKFDATAFLWLLLQR